MIAGARATARIFINAFFVVDLFEYGAGVAAQQRR
jgi:hypothetical protein